MSTPMWRRYLRLFGADPSRDVADELQFHVAERTDDLVAQGMDRPAARHEALRRFGDLNRLKRELTTMGERVERSQRRREGLAGLGRDVRLALRRLGAEPAFTAGALATLALGTGAPVAIFTVVNAVLLRPLPYPEPERLVRVLPGVEYANIALADALAEGAPSLTATTGLSQWRLTMTGEGEPTALPVQAIDPGFFRVFGVQPALGRPFRPEDRDPRRSDVAILSHALWEGRFGGAPEIVGRRIAVDGDGHTSREVVGVMPRGFTPPLAPQGVDVAMWIPLSVAPGRTIATDSTWFLRAIVGRLAPGATVERTAQQVQSRMRSLRDEYANRLEAGAVERAGAMRLLDSMVGDVRGTLWVVLSSVGFVLLLACANLANLLLARGERHRQELAVRAALGAGRRRLVREQLTESAVLALSGGAAGLLLAQGILGVLRVAETSGLPRIAELELDLRVLAFALATSLISSVGFGLLPALRATSGDMRRDLGSGGRMPGRTRSGRSLGVALVAGEIALASVVVTAAALLLNSLRGLRAVDPGLDASDVLTIQLAPPDADYPGERARAFYQELLQRLSALPGVSSAGAINLLPFTDDNWLFPYLAQDHPPPPDGPLPRANFRIITPGYLEAVDMPLLAGRDLSAADDAGGPMVGLINRTMAESLWPNESALGKVINFLGSEPFEVVGVVGDVHQHALDREPQPEMYLTPRWVAEWSIKSMVVLVETTGDPASHAPTVRREVWAIDEDVPITDVRPLESVLGESMARRRFFAGVLTFFGLLALGLGAVGVYGVMAYTTRARRPEFGIRLALGATQGQLLRAAFGQGLLPVAIGLVVGLVGAIAGGRLLSSLLYGVTPGDPLTLTAAGAVLSVVAGAAVGVPAYRLTRIDATRVLRAE